MFFVAILFKTYVPLYFRTSFCKVGKEQKERRINRPFPQPPTHHPAIALCPSLHSHLPTTQPAHKRNCLFALDNHLTPCCCSYVRGVSMLIHRSTLPTSTALFPVASRPLPSLPVTLLVSNAGDRSTRAHITTTQQGGTACNSCAVIDDTSDAPPPPRGISSNTNKQCALVTVSSPPPPLSVQSSRPLFHLRRPHLRRCNRQCWQTCRLLAPPLHGCAPR